MISLNMKEQTRLMVLGEVDRGVMHVAEAAQVLALSERQVQRLLAAYRKEGAAALAHGNRGRQPVHTVPDEVRAQVVALARGTYTGVNQVHFTELLAEREAVGLSRSTVRRILAEAQVPSPRTRRAPNHRSRRDRYPQEGMLVQLDGSPHAWLGDRGPRLSLLAAVDDATGRVVAALFRDQEDSAGYLLLLQQIVETAGRPLAVYHDRHIIFGNDQTADPRTLALAGRRTAPTQVERALLDLGITSIAARSPQAKGRIERLFGSLQDRLVTELRLAGISTPAAAAAFLPGFLARYNARFAVPAALPGSAYGQLIAAMDPEQIFCFQYVRTVGADNTVQLGEHRLQLLPGRTRVSYARCHVVVHERLDGSLAVWYQGQCLATQEAPLEAPVLRARGGRRTGMDSSKPRWEDRPATAPPTEPLPSIRPVLPTWKPAPDHPWRRQFTAQQAQASSTEQ